MDFIVCVFAQFSKQYWSNRSAWLLSNFCQYATKAGKTLGNKAMHVKAVSYEKSHYDDGTKCSPTLRSVKLQSASGSSVRWLELYNGDSKGDQLGI